jgi:hypothetical protein
MHSTVARKKGKWAVAGSDPTAAPAPRTLALFCVYYALEMEKLGATRWIGNAIDLDGSNDFVNIPYATDPTAYTIAAWVKPTDVTHNSGSLPACVAFQPHRGAFGKQRTLPRIET